MPQARRRTDKRRWSARSSVWRIQFEIARDLALPAVAVRQQPCLVVIKLLARFGGKFEIGPFDDGVHGACFLAQPAIDAFHHVDVVARGAAAAVFARFRLDGDGERRAHRLAQFARDATLLAARITAQRMFAAEAWG